MKKIMLSVALLAAVVMTSCGKTACECLKEGMDLGIEAMSSATDTAKMKELEEKAADLDSKCKGFTVEDYAKCK
jgi:hypothetical protein